MDITKHGIIYTASVFVGQSLPVSVNLYSPKNTAQYTIIKTETRKIIKLRLQCEHTY